MIDLLVEYRHWLAGTVMGVGFVGLFNKTTVARKGVVHIAESCPFDFYFISADTDIIG